MCGMVSTEGLPSVCALLPIFDFESFLPPFFAMLHT